MTPAAGPDSTMNTGLTRAALNVKTPPLLCMISISPSRPASCKRSSMLERYRSTMGRTPALMTVVLARKYSRNSGATSEESETTASGKTSAHDLARALLVRRIEVGVEKAHGERFHALLLQLFGHGGDRLLIEGRQHLTGGIEPLRDTEAQIAGHEGSRLLKEQVVEGGPDLPLYLQHVPEPLGGDEAGRSQVPLDDGVGGYRGAMHEVAHVLCLDARLAQDALDGLEEAYRRILWRGGDLRDAGFSRLFVDQDSIRESPPYVDPEPVTMCHAGPVLLSRSMNRSSARWAQPRIHAPESWGPSEISAPPEPRSSAAPREGCARRARRDRPSSTPARNPRRPLGHRPPRPRSLYRIRCLIAPRPLHPSATARSPDLAVTSDASPSRSRPPSTCRGRRRPCRPCGLAPERPSRRARRAARARGRDPPAAPIPRPQGSEN